MNIKQVIVMRMVYPNPKSDPMTYMSPRKGKLIAQGCHGSMAFITKRLMANEQSENRTVHLSDVEIKWLESSYRKICVQVNTEGELLEIYTKAKEAGLESHLVTDNGLTEFDGPTNTCVVIGPDYDEKIDVITGHLKLL